MMSVTPRLIYVVFWTFLYKTLPHPSIFLATVERNMWGQVENRTVPTRNSKHTSISMRIAHAWKHIKLIFFLEKLPYFGPHPCVVFQICNGISIQHDFSLQNTKIGTAHPFSGPTFWLGSCGWSPTS